MSINKMLTPRCGKTQNPNFTNMGKHEMLTPQYGKTQNANSAVRDPTKC